MASARRHEVHRKATLFSCHLPPYILHGHHVPPSQLPPPFPLSAATSAAAAAAAAAAASMAATSKASSFLLLLLLFFCYFLAFAACRPGRLEEGQAMTSHSDRPPPLNNEVATTKAATGMRTMIGSTAPICTYNECRGCRFKCSAEQVPVDAGDPMNSAYRYRCVCHR